MPLRNQAHLNRTILDTLAYTAIITRAAPAPPQLVQTESSASRTKDVDSDHVSTVVNEYKGETSTQMDRLQREAKEAGESAKKRFADAEEEARKDYGKGKGYAGKKAKDAKSAMTHAGHDINENRDNPVVIGNAVVWTVIGAALGYAFPA